MLGTHLSFFHYLFFFFLNQLITKRRAGCFLKTLNAVEFNCLHSSLLDAFDLARGFSKLKKLKKCILQFQPLLESPFEMMFSNLPLLHSTPTSSERIVTRPKPFFRLLIWRSLFGNSFSDPLQRLAKTDLRFTSRCSIRNENHFEHIYSSGSNSRFRIGLTEVSSFESGTVDFLHYLKISD